MKPFSLLIKPASADCNLNCAYCFYLDRASLYPQARKHRMTEETLEAVVENYMRTPQPQYAFAWQGGEPTLMGVNFFKRVVELQIKHGSFGASVANHLQTNGILITEEFARHLAQYHFLVGVSLDGPPALHDRFRTFSSGGGSHDQVMKGISILKNNRVNVNVLTLVSTANANSGKQVFRYLIDQGFDYHQYIPCVEFDEAGKAQPFCITAGSWGDFLCEIFDEWVNFDAGKVSVRFFDSLLHHLVSGDYNLCHLGRNCCEYFVVEHNGDVYPCDFFVDSELKLGNVRQDSFMDLKKSSRYLAFGAQKSQWSQDCTDCEYLDFCSADCLKNRLNYGSRTPGQKSWLCEGYKQFFSHALPRLKEMAEEFQMRAPFVRQPERTAAQKQKVGRNEPCPCGSGRKYKKCCGGL